MSDNANFTEHISKVCKIVNQKCGWILRTFVCRNTFFMKLMWKSLVQPNIDYCSQLWMPFKSGEMEKIENLQKQFTKRIPEVKNLSYWDRLKKLKMLSQERRMERYRIIYTWKILEGKSPNCGIQNKNHDRLGRLCEIPKIIANSKKSIQTLRENSFQINGPKLFNCLPKKIRNKKGCSIEEFKAELDQFLEKIPDQPKSEGYIPNACNQSTAIPSVYEYWLICKISIYHCYN